MIARPMPSTTRRVLAEIVSYMVESSGRPPTVRDIGRRAGIKSTSNVAFHLAKLKKAGLITTGEEREERGITVPGATWTPPPALAHLVVEALPAHARTRTRPQVKREAAA